MGKLNYLAQTTRPDIAYATHQIVKYSTDPNFMQKPTQAQPNHVVVG